MSPAEVSAIKDEWPDGIHLCLEPPVVAALSHLPDPVLCFDRKFQCIFANGAAVRLMGVVPPAEGGREPGELGLPSVWASRIVNRLGSVFRNDGPSAFSAWLENGVMRRFYHVQIMRESAISGGVALLVARDITVLQKAGEMVRSSEERFVAFMENLPAASWICNSGGVLETCNAEYARIFHSTPATLCGRRVPEFAPDGMAAHWMQNNSRVIETGEPMTTTEQALRPDGSIGEFLVYKFPIVDGHDPCIGGTAIDVTERRLAEDRLERLKRLYEISSCINDAIGKTCHLGDLYECACSTAVERGGLAMAWIGLLDSANWSVSPIACFGEDAGYIEDVLADTAWLTEARSKTNQAIRLGSWSISNDIARDPEFQMRERALRAGFRSAAIFPLVRKSAVQALLFFYARQTGFFQEEEVRVLQALADNLAFAADIAEMEVLEREARQTVRAQSEWLDQAGEAIRFTDLEGGVLYWNRAAEQIYGVLSAEAVGLKVEDLVPSAREMMREAFEGTLRDGQWEGELFVTPPGGPPVFAESCVLESRWSLVRNEDGAPQGILVIDADITQKKRMEEQFLRSQRLEGIGVLAGGIAHDLNNILAPILLSLHILRDAVQDPGSTRLLDTVECSAQRGADLIKQILMYARGFESPKVPVHPGELVHEIATFVGEILPKSIETLFQTDEPVLPVRGDRTQLTQMLLNLCVNARDAMPDGGNLCLRVFSRNPNPSELQAHPEIKDVPHTYFEVVDTGTGIPDEVLGKIFEPFFTTKDTGKGTGLGLSTCITIVTSHKGFLDVETSDCGGSTFRVFLPAVVDAPGPAALPPEKEVPTGHGETLLIVDDEASVRMITRQILQNEGYRTIEASSGDEALSILRQRGGHIDLLLTDLMMPGIPGEELVMEVRKLHPQLPLIMISGMPEHDSEVRHLSGMGEFLEKPYTSRGLLDMVARALRCHG